MSAPARLVPDPPDDVRRLPRPSDVFVFAATPPQPDEFDGDGFVVSGEETPLEERLTAAVKLAAVIVAAAFASASAMWAFGSAAVRAVSGLGP
jgi:hypothetical protein